MGLKRVALIVNGENVTSEVGLGSPTDLTEFAQQVSDHLRNFSAAPILFVGSGVTRRYLNLPDWKSLLAELAALTERDYSYYRSTASNNSPQMAQLLIEPLKTKMWQESESALRQKYEDQLIDPSSALKVYVTEILNREEAQTTDDSQLLQEIELLRKAKIDAVITTNYDGFMENLFPDFKVFVGQDELVFSEPAGIGEIYKIHGSLSDPNSIIFTTDDCESFKGRNTYLAAKLLTLFAEHPIIFLGYGFGDPDVLEILSSLANCLRDKNLSRLQDRLLFVNWQPDSTPAMVGTVMAAGTHSIPVHMLTVPNYEDVFSALQSLERKYSAKTLRHLKEHVYSLVLDETKHDRLHVANFDGDGSVDLVLGVGVIAELQKHGYRGLNRIDVCMDLLHDRDFESDFIVKMTLPDLLSRPGNFPAYKHLSLGGYLNADGQIKDPDILSPKLLRWLGDVESKLRPVKSLRKKATKAAQQFGDFNNMARQCTTDDTLAYFGAFSRDEIDIDELEAFLLKIETSKVRANGDLATNFAKAICVYDLLKYGPNTAWAKRLV
ncbi:hypothetical protein AUR04nite_35270 [Glutamicibacter uratoxydans]|uniref:Uncharacterized protein n=1 Tax=Glutamicibacter uratoxydans TaxID=43667 RepID=A0A4Y4DWK7_GLUUR|nr:hypothetical protein AUR04nite_35270 [Glutamicibacter uratoxydans]